MEVSKERKSTEFWIIAAYMVCNIIVCWWWELSGLRFPFQVGLNNSIFLCVIVIRYLLVICKEKRIPKPEIVDIAIIMLAVFAIIATFLSVNIESSLWGTFTRDEGIYALITYYLLFFCASQIEESSEKKILIKLFLFLGIFSSFVGIISGYGILDFLPSKWDGRAALPFGNPNFYCTFCCLLTAMSMGVILYAEDKRLSILGYVGYSFSIMAGLETNGSMCFSGNICAFLLVLFVELVLRRGKKNKLGKQMLKMFWLIIIYIALILLNEFTRDSAFSNEMLANWNDLEKGWFADSWFSGRMGVWKAAFRVLPEHWLHGVGVDCFQFAMSSPSLNGRFIMFDKAHNEYIQIMITEGIFACITYIWFLFILFIRGIKQSVMHIEKRDYYFMALFIAFFSYIAQAFFNISVPNIAPYFWIFCGLLYERKRPENASHIK